MPPNEYEGAIPNRQLKIVAAPVFLIKYDSVVI